MHDPTIYAWRGRFNYAADGKPAKPIWRYHDKDQWLVENSSWSPVDRAKAILEFRDELITELGELGLKKRPPPPLLLEWLANGGGGAPPVTEGVAVMLNHIVAEGRIEPFKILATFVYGHLAVEIKKLPNGSPSWFYLNLENDLTYLDEYLLMLPNWFFKTTGEGKESKIIKVLDRDKIDKRFSTLRSVRILHEYSVLLYQHHPNRLEISLRDQATVVPYPKGRVCHVLPIPGRVCADKWKAAEPYSVLTPEVVVASPNVAECLTSLSRLWQDRFAKSVLISAPPGSGKEAFAASIPYGSGRVSGPLLSISLASEDTGSLERRLFGRRREDGSIEPGLIAKAANSALFLDEVHQPEQSGGIRPSLLRPLEADEYFPAESNYAERVENVLFILATSKSLDKLGKVRPPDFWTRMTHVVPIKHPLDYPEADGVASQIDVLKCFFKCFWWDRLERYYKLDPARIKDERDHAAMWLKECQVRLLLDDDALDRVSRLFAECLLRLHRGELSEFSVRGIRSVVSRMFALAVSEVSRGKSEDWEIVFSERLEDVIKEISVVAHIGEGQERLG